MLVQPTKNQPVKIELQNLEKGFLATSIPGYPAILGGGNQFILTQACADIGCSFTPSLAKGAKQVMSASSSSEVYASLPAAALLGASMAKGVTQFATTSCATSQAPAGEAAGNCNLFKC